MPNDHSADTTPGSLERTRALVARAAALAADLPAARALVDSHDRLVSERTERDEPLAELGALVATVVPLFEHLDLPRLDGADLPRATLRPLRRPPLRVLGAAEVAREDGTRTQRARGANVTGRFHLATLDARGRLGTVDTLGVVGADLFADPRSTTVVTPLQIDARLRTTRWIAPTEATALDWPALVARLHERVQEAHDRLLAETTLVLERERRLLSR